MVSAHKTVSATYEHPYVKHAPIGAFIAVADVRSDGTVTVWTHSAQSQGLRAHLAHMLGVSTEKVTVRWLEGAGQYGRTTLGGDGAEADAVILSQELGRPVRVQWTLQEDFAWSSASPAGIADVKAGLDASGRSLRFRATTTRFLKATAAWWAPFLPVFQTLPREPASVRPSSAISASGVRTHRRCTTFRRRCIGRTEDRISAAMRLAGLCTSSCAISDSWLRV